ncbi:hypothetical protein Hypma_009730 [Hypsizygus marmoreus]|uniref:G-protein coupled receptors family 1 profile domain-containing protein n=1 Tax=Hypsizygus marmoreus TaxID=39966 RepID=A0A369JLJ8_HYPMA|nr:hypothetical protein Hypma_009730 [Hypsizygus marmoreus]
MPEDFPILNPLAPMVHLPPPLAALFTNATYVILGSIGALSLDILVNLGSDYRLLFTHRVTFPTVIYFVSRASALIYTLLNGVFNTAPLGMRCQVDEKTLCVLFHVAFSSTALLFFLRVRAVFNDNKYVIRFFFILWLAVLGGSLTVSTVGGATEIGPTHHCNPKPLKTYIIAAPITFAINDTFVFLAISWRLLMNSWDPDVKRSFKVVAFGEYLPRFSQALLQDGQVYYLVSVTSNLVSVILTFTSGGPNDYLYMFIVNCSLTNMMACRVYRHTKFGDFREETISTSWLASHHGRIDSFREEGTVVASVPRAFDLGSSGAEKIDADRQVETGQPVKRSKFLYLLSVILVVLPFLCVFLCSRTSRHPA